MHTFRLPRCTRQCAWGGIFLFASACGDHGVGQEDGGGASPTADGSNDVSAPSEGRDASPIADGSGDASAPCDGRDAGTSRDSASLSDARDVAADLQADAPTLDSPRADAVVGDVFVADVSVDISIPDVSVVDAPVADAPLVNRVPVDAEPPPDGPLHGWASVTTPIVRTPRMAWFSEAPSDPNVILAGAESTLVTQHNLYRSTDGGSTWAQLHAAMKPMFQPVFCAERCQGCLRNSKRTAIIFPRAYCS